MNRQTASNKSTSHHHVFFMTSNRFGSILLLLTVGSSVVVHDRCCTIQRRSSITVLFRGLPSACRGRPIVSGLFRLSGRLGATGDPCLFGHLQ